MKLSKECAPKLFYSWRYTLRFCNNSPRGPDIRYIRVIQMHVWADGPFINTCGIKYVWCRTLYYTILYYTILYYTILYYTILYYTILYYTILYYTILYYTILYYTILYYTILYYTILYYTILYYTILYYTILYYTILYYTILYYTILYSEYRYGSPLTFTRGRKFPDISKCIFWKWINFDQHFTAVFSQQYFSIGPDNGWAPGRRQTNIWTNDS